MNNFFLLYVIVCFMHACKGGRWIMKYKRLLTAFMTTALITGSIAPQAMAANFADINDVPWEGAKNIHKLCS